MEKIHNNAWKRMVPNCKNKNGDISLRGPVA